jgi:hypothetical protein
MSDLYASDAEQLLFRDDRFAKIYSLLKALRQADRNKYGIWVVNRLRPNYERLAHSMNWQVASVLGEISIELSEKVGDETPDVQEVRRLSQSLPEGEDGCSEYWANGLDYLSAVDEICLGIEQLSPLPYAKLFQVCSDQVDRDILHELLGKTSGPHSPSETREINSIVMNHARMEKEFLDHETYLKSLGV